MNHVQSGTKRNANAVLRILLTIMHPRIKGDPIASYISFSSTRLLISTLTAQAVPQAVHAAAYHRLWNGTADPILDAVPRVDAREEGELVQADLRLQ